MCIPVALVSLGASAQEDELRVLLEKKPHPVCYDGFEPSGRMHIAQGILKAINVRCRHFVCASAGGCAGVRVEVDSPLHSSNIQPYQVDQEHPFLATYTASPPRYAR